MNQAEAKIEAVKRWGYQARAEQDTKDVGGRYPRIVKFSVSSRYNFKGESEISFQDAFENVKRRNYDD